MSVFSLAWSSAEVVPVPLWLQKRDVLNSGVSPTHWSSPAQTRAFKTTRFGSHACPVSAPGFVPLVPALGLCDQVFRWDGLVVRWGRARSVRVDQKRVVLNAGVSPSHLPAPAQTPTFKATRFGSRVNVA